MSLSPEAATMARNKFEELKKLTEQRQLVNLELINRLAKALDKVKAGPGLAGIAPGPASVTASKQPAKRAPQPSGLGAPEAKRPKLDSEVDKKIDNLWRSCASILDFLMKKKSAIIFSKPVDPVRDKVPDYFKFISHPMDLGTIKSKLSQRKYNDVREFAADVRLVWSNCRTYNSIGTPVRIWGDQLSDDWEKKWAESNIEQRWDDLVLQRDPQAISLDRRIASSARQLLQRVNSVHSLPAADPSRPMSTVEKRKLSIALSELQGDQLGEVLNIIAENLKNINPDDEDEIELDVDQLDNLTLWRLREYCDNVANRQTSKPAVPSKAAAGGESRPAHDGGKHQQPQQQQQQQQQQQRSKPPARTESGSESDRYSAEQDVKGSNMVEQPQSQPNFVKNQRSAALVEESATAPKDKSAIATDKKSNKDVVLNASAWQAADEEPAEGGGEAADAGAGGEEEGDDLWDSFRSVAEREKQQKAEEEKRRKELEQEREKERLRAVAEARQAKEEEERKIREAEEAAAAEAKRAKDEARQKELEELQMQANTAQVYQPPDAKAFAQTFGAGGADINDLGLMYKHDDDADDVGFDD